MLASLGCTMRQSYPFLPYLNGAPTSGGKSVGGALDGLDKVDSGKMTGPLFRCWRGALIVCVSPRSDTRRAGPPRVPARQL